MDYEAALEEQRPFLWGYCYRLTGNAADAEDAVQETFVRALERPPADVERPWRPWLVRVATNLVRDEWRSARRRYVGTWLPSPIDTDAQEGMAAAWKAGLEEDAQARYEALESVSFAFLLALEVLTPRQRAVLLLRDVYDYSGIESAEALAMSVANVKTTLHRARRALADYDRNREPPSAQLQRRQKKALGRLMECFVTRDVRAMEHLLAVDIAALSDGAGEFRAAKVPVVGRQKVALFFSNVVPDPQAVEWEFRTVNGQPALLFHRPDPAPGLAPRWMFRVEVNQEGLVRRTHAVLATRKLVAMA